MEKPNSIARHHAEILADWIHGAGELVAARGLSLPELTNIMPKYLSALAQLDRDRRDRQLRIESHLSARLRAGYRLDDVLEELALLGRCVVRACEKTAADALSPPELAALDDALRQDAVFVMDSFAVYLREDEQEEKFFLRRLETLAAGTLRGEPSKVGREAGLRAILALVMEATGSQSAALLLRDKVTGELCTAASVGVVEPTATYGVGEAAASFVATVARHEEAITIQDAANTTLELSDALRASGVHALGGVRLPMHYDLLGVMYVGLTSAGGFSSRQTRRLETLGEQLALHLDRARLDDELRATIQDLRVERELRERFISVLAHDLRSPLSVARFGAEMLRANAESLGPHRDLPARIVRSVIRADRMIHDLLDVLRVRAGHGLPLVLGPCDLAEVTRATVEELAALHGPRFEVRCAPHVHGVWCADTLQRALWNLIVNAVKYGAEDTPVVVSVTSVDAGVTLSVQNAGPVIPSNVRSSLFEPFTRFDSGGIVQRSGWGLGLTMVKSCAEAHGGVVTVESTVALGTTFTMTLPLDARPYQLRSSAAAD